MQYAKNAIIEALVSHNNARFMAMMFTSQAAAEREIEQTAAVSLLWKKALSEIQKGAATMV